MIAKLFVLCYEWVSLNKRIDMDDIDWSAIKILIVEDSPTQAIKLEEDLKRRGSTVLVAHDGIQALEIIRINPPSIVVSDINMPNMNGYELCRHIKSELNLPVILLTVLSDPLDVIHGIECGADYFLTKPCRSDLLFSYLADVLEEKKMNLVMQEKTNYDVAFNGKRYNISSTFLQITNLLLSTYSSAIQKNEELEKVNKELSLAQHQLEEKNKNLASLNAEKNTLLGMAAHDLRTPLGVIMGYADLLLEDSTINADEKVRLKFEHIKSSSAHMLNIIDDLLDIAMIESGKVKLNRREQNLSEVISNQIKLIQDLAKKKNIQIEYQEKGPIPLMNFDRDKIEQVLTNLLTNAIKYSQPNTKIRISLSSTIKEVILSVADEGTGIPPDEQKLLFNIFTKTSAQATGGEPSVGLGLAIVKKIVEAHQGKIGIESIVGKGSTFFISLPIGE